MERINTRRKNRKKPQNNKNNNTLHNSTSCNSRIKPIWDNMRYNITTKNTQIEIEGTTQLIDTILDILIKNTEKEIKIIIEKIY